MENKTARVIFWRTLIFSAFHQNIVPFFQAQSNLNQHRIRSSIDLIIKNDIEKLKVPESVISIQLKTRKLVLSKSLHY